MLTVELPCLQPFRGAQQNKIRVCFSNVSPIVCLFSPIFWSSSGFFYSVVGQRDRKVSWIQNGFKGLGTWAKWGRFVVFHPLSDSICGHCSQAQVLRALAQKVLGAGWACDSQIAAG